MNRIGTLVSIVVALVFAALTPAWSEGPDAAVSDEEVLCEIYSRNPTERVIKVDSGTRPRTAPVVVHRCQELTLKTIGGDATISIVDIWIAEANKTRVDGKLDGVVGNTVVLHVPAAREPPASIVVPEDYPNPDQTVIVRYFVECFDPVTEDSYPCEGGSPPIIIIPPRKR